jgi:glycosyltransferase involved in cell wall biosynthesis
MVFLSFTSCRVVISFMGDDLIGSVGNDKNYTFFSKILVQINKKLAESYYDFSITKSKQLDRIISKTKNKKIVPNGVNLNVFYPYDRGICRDRLGIDRDENIVLFASDPARPEKNFSLASDAVLLVNNKETRLITVYSEEQSTLNYYYNATDVLLLTSVHEGSPNVIKEAMACGCPIVTTDVGDVKEIIGRTNGCFISDLCPKSLARNLISAIKFRRDVGFTPGRERLLDLKLDSTSVAERLVSIYKSVIAGA